MSEHFEHFPQPEAELRFNAASEWLHGLLELPLTLQLGDGQSSSGAEDASKLVGPRAIVDLVLEYRIAVAEDWIRILRQVPDQYLAVKREHLSKLVAGSGS